MAQTVEELALRYVMLVEDLTNFFLDGYTEETRVEIHEIEDILIDLLGVDGFYAALKHARKVLAMVNHFPT